MLCAGLEDDVMAALSGRYIQVLLWELLEAPWSTGIDCATLRIVGCSQQEGGLEAGAESPLQQEVRNARWEGRVHRCLEGVNTQEGQDSPCPVAKCFQT